MVVMFVIIDVIEIKVWKEKFFGIIIVGDFIFYFLILKNSEKGKNIIKWKIW